MDVLLVGSIVLLIGLVGFLVWVTCFYQATSSHYDQEIQARAPKDLGNWKD